MTVEPSNRRVVCIRVSGGPPPVLSTRAQCVDCLREVWISLTMAPMVQNEGVLPLCVECGRTLARTKAPTYHLDERQKGELAVVGIIDFAEEFVDRANRGERW